LVADSRSSCAALRTSPPEEPCAISLSSRSASDEGTTNLRDSTPDDLPHESPFETHFPSAGFSHAANTTCLTYGPHRCTALLSRATAVPRCACHGEMTHHCTPDAFARVEHPGGPGNPGGPDKATLSNLRVLRWDTLLFQNPADAPSTTGLVSQMARSRAETLTRPACSSSP